MLFSSAVLSITLATRRGESHDVYFNAVFWVWVATFVHLIVINYSYAFFGKRVDYTFEKHDLMRDALRKDAKVGKALSDFAAAIGMGLPVPPESNRPPAPQPSSVAGPRNEPNPAPQPGALPREGRR